MSEPTILRFGGFELHLGPAELRLNGDPVRLAPQPLKVLELLARSQGKVLTRDEIRQHVWAGDTFVDFEQGLNFCIRQIREALGDTASAPQFVETLPRRGYRFLMPVTEESRWQPSRAKRLIVLPFFMLRPDQETDFLAFSLPDALTHSLSGLTSLVVRSSMSAARFGGQGVDPKTIASEADVDAIVTGTLLRSGDRIRVTSELTEASTGTLLWSDTAEAPIGDLFGLQDELARRILDSLKLPLTSEERRLLGHDVPSTAKAYDYYLRGNQLSYDSKQWAVARDLYLRCVELDPRYAPAWARLGRIYHVMGKYLSTATSHSAHLAEAAFRKALESNPELPLAHKLYAQFEVDQGLAREAMVRLVERAHATDPELFAGLVTTCRYCGLLDASEAAHEQAVALEPKIRTSVPHTWYFQSDYPRVARLKPSEFPYIVPLSMAELGQAAEALVSLRELEQKIPTRVRDIVTAARFLLEGNSAESIAAITRFVTDFRDPEALFYAGRHLARLKATEPAIDLLARAVAGGFFCFPAFARDPWLDSIRKKPGFTKVLREAETQHRSAEKAFTERGGAELLRIS